MNIRIVCYDEVKYLPMVRIDEVHIPAPLILQVPLISQWQNSQGRFSFLDRPASGDHDPVAWGGKYFFVFVFVLLLLQLQTYLYRQLNDQLHKNCPGCHVLYFADVENEHDLQIALTFSEYHYQLLHQNFLYKNINRLQEKEQLQA